MNHRIHFLVTGEDKARYESQAAAEGLSLGAWLREAAEHRYLDRRARAPFRDAAELDEFFARCESRDDRPEPDWEDQRRWIEASKLSGVAGS